MFKWEGGKVQCTVQLLSSSSSSSSSMFNANFFSNWGYYCPISYCHCWAGKVCPMQLTTAVLFNSIFILNWASIKFACSFVGTAFQLSDTQKKLQKNTTTANWKTWNNVCSGLLSVLRALNHSVQHSADLLLTHGWGLLIGLSVLTVNIHRHSHRTLN